jgi:hypothetical protein
VTTVTSSGCLRRSDVIIGWALDNLACLEGFYTSNTYACVHVLEIRTTLLIIDSFSTYVRTKTVFTSIDGGPAMRSDLTLT